MTSATYGCDLVGDRPEAQRQDGRVVHQDRLRLVVQGHLLVLVGLGGGLLDQRIEVGVAVLAVVVAAVAGEQAIELVVRVRIVGTPAVAGDGVVALGPLGEEDAEVGADLVGLETERLAPGLGQEGDPRLVAGVRVEAELELAEVGAALVLPSAARALAMWSLAEARSNGYGSRSGW